MQHLHQQASLPIYVCLCVCVCVYWQKQFAIWKTLHHVPRKIMTPPYSDIHCECLHLSTTVLCDSHLKGINTLQVRWYLSNMSVIWQILEMFSYDYGGSWPINERHHFFPINAESQLVNVNLSHLRLICRSRLVGSLFIKVLDHSGLCLYERNKWSS